MVARTLLKGVRGSLMRWGTTLALCAACSLAGYPAWAEDVPARNYPYYYPYAMPGFGGPQTYPGQAYPAPSYPANPYSTPQRESQKSGSGGSMGSRRSQAPQRDGYSPGYRQPGSQSQPNSTAPRYVTPVVETRISEVEPYVHQNLVYIIRVLSEGNLFEASPVAPGGPSVVTRQLEGPTTYSTQSGGERRIVTEYRYLLMPLNEGAQMLEPARVSGYHADASGGKGPDFEASAPAGQSLTVRPAQAETRPWLPLYDLRIRSRVLGLSSLTAGKPFQLQIESTVQGATGSQIPSIAAQLQGEGYRIYPGESQVEGEITRSGGMLTGRRLETYTLVPRYGGQLNIPAISINWWNVRQNQPEVAAVPAQSFRVAGDPRPGGPINEPKAQGLLASAWFWAPLLFVGLYVLLIWLWARLGSGAARRTGPGLFDRFVAPLFHSLFGDYYDALRVWAARHAPSRHLHRLRTWIGRHLPVSWKLWFCLRAVEQEDDPEEWAQALQILATKHLGVPPHSSLQVLGEGISACHPKARPQAVSNLMAELDRAVFGGVPIADFQRWKQDLWRQIKPSLLRIRFRRDRCEPVDARQRMKLPDLNPG